jgi:3-hydroxyacyl-CoA dehydrogenase/enoyl-CoA hydratase/3-hydroxybutyryl-CoA epimerase
VTTVRYERAEDGVVTLVLDAPGRPVNTLDTALRAELAAAVERLEAERDGAEGLTGVVLTSAKDTFVAGADIDELLTLTPADAERFAGAVRELKATFRRLETLGVPVAAALTGAALGGGLELALACHHRVLVDDPAAKVGFPEVQLGLLPGGGGTVRAVRLLGILPALPLLLEGTRLGPAKALAAGLVDAVAPTREETVAAAQAWVRSGPEPTQPWDRKGFRLPGGAPTSPSVAQALMAAPAMLAAKTHRAMPAPERLLAAVVEGAHVGVDAAMEIETRYFTELAVGQTSTNMITTLFFGIRSLDGGASRPADVPRWRPTRAAVLGGGMMGSGIAHALVGAGVPVVLLEADAAGAERARGRVVGLLDTAVARGRLTQERRDATAGLLTTTADVGDLAGVDLVVEAVFERRDLKEQVLTAAVAQAAPDALLASNTSTLPITGLAQFVSRPEAFVGLHFFSPVHKMPLVEIIRGEKTADEAVARAFDVVRLVRKTPIVVNDGRGFFTSRVFGTFTEEGMAMLAEGVPAAMIEQEARGAGMPVGPLAVTDEVSLSLVLDIRRQTEADLAAEGRTLPPHPAYALVGRLVDDLGRRGRASGGGFYDYPEDGPKRLWPGLADLVGRTADVPAADVRDRLLFIQALESIRAMEDGVVTSATEANVGSILGIGFPPATGGVLQFVTGYAEGAGPAAFLARAEELAAAYGERFTPPTLLREVVEAGGRF